MEEIVITTSATHEPAGDDRDKTITVLEKSPPTIEQMRRSIDSRLGGQRFKSPKKRPSKDVQRGSGDEVGAGDNFRAISFTGMFPTIVEEFQQPMSSEGDDSTTDSSSINVD